MPSYRVSMFKPQSYERLLQHGPQTALINNNSSSLAIVGKGLINK